MKIEDRRQASAQVATTSHQFLYTQESNCLKHSHFCFCIVIEFSMFTMDMLVTGYFMFAVTVCI